ncbi:MAG TPA: hypothetical protein VGG74_31715 [Kofleriaceae bacterium]
MLRITVEVAKRLADAWREAGLRDFMVPAALKVELAQCIGAFRDAAELLQLVRAASAESDRILGEYTQAQNRLGSLVALFGELAVRIPALAEALGEVRAKLDGELTETLEQALAFYSRQRAAVEPGASPGEAAARSESPSPAAIRDEVSREAITLSRPDVTQTDARATASDAAGADAEASRAPTAAHPASSCSTHGS